MLIIVFAGIWEGVYTTAQANGVGTNGLGSAALGEILFLLLGFPVLLSVFHRTAFSGIALVAGLIGVALLGADQLFFNLFCSGALLCIPITNSVIGTYTAAGLSYVTSPIAAVVTLGAFSVSEVSAMQGFLRGILDSILGIKSPISGGIVSLLIYGPFFALLHTFVTISAYTSLLGVKPLYGTLNLAVLLTPFGLSALVAQMILDTLVRLTGFYESALVAHPLFDMLITAHAVGLY
jgi:hypothetical protein